MPEYFVEIRESVAGPAGELAGALLLQDHPGMPALVEEAPVAMLIVDADREIRYANRLVTELAGRHRVRNDLRVNVRLPHAPRNQLCVLRPEVDDQYGLLRHDLAQWPIPTPCDLCRFLPSVCKAGATMISAFWNSLTDS